jgi:CheY-like chemotaxis protein
VNVNDSIKTILLVEDDAAIRTTLGFFLESLGLRYLSAADGRQATKILETEPVDVLITDFQMPNMDGIELLQWCRARNMHLPVIFISANAHSVASEQIALQDCCATLMGKPIDLDVLNEALDAAVKLIHHPNCVHQRSTPLR